MNKKADTGRQTPNLTTDIYFGNIPVQRTDAKKTLKVCWHHLEFVKSKTVTADLKACTKSDVEKSIEIKL